MAEISLDVSRWPLIMVSYPKSFRDADWVHLLDRIVALMQREEDFGMINDVRDAPVPTALQRSLIVEMYEAHIKLVQRHWKGTAIIGNSRVVVGVLTALNWLMPPPHPAKVFSDFEEGEAWVRARLGIGHG